MANETPEPGYVQVITTVDTEQAAHGLARMVVEKRLGACAQVSGPIASVYWWQGAIEEATEWCCVIKTTAAKYAALEHLIVANHPYSVPEVLAVPVLAGNADYLKWLRQGAG